MRHALALFLATSVGVGTALSGCRRTGPVDVSVAKQLSLPGSQVPQGHAFLGTEAFTLFNRALVLNVTNTTSGIAALSDKEMTVQIVDETGARYDALGYIPIDISRTDKNYPVQAAVNIDEKNNALTQTLTYTRADGAPVTARTVRDDAGSRWTLEFPPGKPTSVSCIFQIPSNRRAVHVALPGNKDLVVLPPTLPAAR